VDPARMALGALRHASCAMRISQVQAGPGEESQRARRAPMMERRISPHGGIGAPLAGGVASMGMGIVTQRPSRAEESP
jgi:hypothetical protein